MLLAMLYKDPLYTILLNIAHCNIANNSICSINWKIYLFYTNLLGTKAQYIYYLFRFKKNTWRYHSFVWTFIVIYKNIQKGL